MEPKKGNHSVYMLHYHLILVVKYRKPCITDEIGDFLLSEAKKLLQSWNGDLIEGNYEPDHIHLLIELDPQHELACYIGVLKKTLSYNVRKKYGDFINKYLWKDSFWSDSYYVASTGGANFDVMQKYIQNQGKPKRQYHKTGKYSHMK